MLYNFRVIKLIAPIHIYDKESYEYRFFTDETSLVINVENKQCLFKIFRTKKNNTRNRESLLSVVKRFYEDRTGNTLKCKDTLRN